VSGLVPSGDEIREARDLLGWTQAYLASRLNVSMETISNWERGATSAKRHAGRLRAVLGMDRPEPQPQPQLGLGSMLVSELWALLDAVQAELKARTAGM
jgi:transcriptional regulator with XRE-family HTH domain